MKKSIGQKIASLISTLLIIFLSLLVVLFIVLPLFGYKAYVVKSGSMEPIIHTGSVAFVDTHEKDLKVNDIGVYTLGNDETVIHRLVDIDEDGYIFKGDANDIADLSSVTDGQIVGKYMFSIPAIGYLTADIQANRKLLIPITCVIGIVLILLNLFSGEDESTGERKKHSRTSTDHIEPIGNG